MKILKDVFNGGCANCQEISPKLNDVLQQMDEQKYGRKGFKKVSSKTIEMYCITAQSLEAFLKDLLSFSVESLCDQCKNPKDDEPIIYTYDNLPESIKRLQVPTKRSKYIID